MTITLHEIDLGSSPDRSKHVRLAARLGGGGSKQTIWFDVPTRFADDIVTSADPWLILLLPLAASTGHDLRLPRDVDERLLRNSQELIRIWDCWYPWTDRTRLRVGTRSRAEPTGLRTMSFFSGGVDSFYTLLRSRERTSLEKNDSDSDSATAREQIDDLLTVCGFDIPHHRTEACQGLFSAAREVANTLDKVAVTLVTNLRATSWGDAVPWEKLGFGPALAACAHLLGTRYSRALMPAGTGYYRMSPRGAHPLTTPYMGSSRLTVVLDGAASSRVEKTRRVAHSPVARRHLRVCWRSGTHRNCGTCEKCYRTMLTLRLLGQLSAVETFDADRLRMSRVPRIFAQKESDVIFLRQIEKLARDRGDDGAVRAIQAAVRRSWIKRRILSFADRMGEIRGLWTASRRLRRMITARSLS